MLNWANWFATFSLLICTPAWATHCVVNVQSLNFGVYQPFDPGPLSSQAGIEVFCEAPVPYQVSMDAGLNANGDIRDRRMQGPTVSTLRYNLYLDAAASQLWGDGSAGTEIFSGLAGAEAQVIPLHGRVPPGQMPEPGVYSDSVIVTISW